MSSFNGRRAPNVSQYLANLNTIPGPHDIAASQNDFAVADDLDFLTNAEFFDFDTFNPIGDFAQQQGVDATAADKAQHKQGSTAVTSHGPGYQFSEFQTYPTLSNSPSSGVASPTNGAAYTGYPLQPGQAYPQTGDKRKASVAALPSIADFEDSSRFAAEEDKRRRNTAASARFRVKKKQREQALEKQAKDMSEKVQMLEGKVQQLEMENKWLKELITEKGKESGASAAERKASEGEAAERSTETRTDGVGTAEVEA